MDKNLNLQVGTIIGDWVVCSSNNNTMTLFPLKNQAHRDWDDANEFCSNFNTSPLSGWVVTSSKLPSQSDFENIVSQTGMNVKLLINDSNNIWLSDQYYDFFYSIGSDGIVRFNDYEGYGYGVRPLITITLVK